MFLLLVILTDGRKQNPNRTTHNNTLEREEKSSGSSHVPVHSTIRGLGSGSISGCLVRVLGWRSAGGLSPRNRLLYWGLDLGV